MDNLSLPVWTWMNGKGTIRSYIHKIIVRNRDRPLFRRPQFVQNAYSDHRMVKYTMYIGMAYNQFSGYWKLNNSIMACDTFRNEVK